jgi:hypothetical protein
MKIRRWILLVTGLIMVLAAVSCTPPPMQPYFDTNIVCKNLVLFVTSVDNLQNTSITDKNAFTAQFDVARRNYQNLVQSYAAVNSAQKDNFEKSVGALQEAASQLPQDATVTDSVKQLSPYILAVKKSAIDLQTGINCPVVSTTPSSN